MNKGHFLAAVFLTALFLLNPGQSALSDDNATITVIDLANNPSTSIPDTLRHVMPKKSRFSTNYSIEDGENGLYLRAMSSGTSSWLEMNLDDVDPETIPFMEWQWLVNEFPETEWENRKNEDDYAIRIELVYDRKGSVKNPLNIIRKGLIKSIFKGYPPELVISYVWSKNVPPDESFVSPTSKNTIIIPVESDVAMMGRWVTERRNIFNDYESLWENPANLCIKKIRIKADTESVPSVSESGLKYLRFTTE